MIQAGGVKARASRSATARIHRRRTPMFPWLIAPWTMPSRRTFICCCKLHSLRSHSPLGARVRLDVIMLGNLPRNHAAQEQLNLLEKSIYTRAIDPDRSEIAWKDGKLHFRCVRARFCIIRPSASRIGERCKIG